MLLLLLLSKGLVKKVPDVPNFLLQSLHIL
jgi:hypothetical protein